MCLIGNNLPPFIQEVLEIPPLSLNISGEAFRD
jgi:hypothetical protein